MFSLITSFFRSTIALGGAYLLGAYGFSYSWIVFGLAAWIIRDYFAQEKIARLQYGRILSENEKTVITARLGDLPSWVFFPDTERAEWLNRIIKQMWPYFGDFMTDLIKDVVEPAIRQSLPSYLQSFRFERIILGDIPPRIGGIKVYIENVARDEMIMDLEFLYSGDCEFVIGVKRLKAGIKELQLHGTLRVIARPLVKKMPLLGGLSIFFLTPPAVDFNLTKLADVLDIPGLSDMLRQAVIENLRTWIVLPNKFPIQVIPEVPLQSLKFTIPAGVLRINVIGAKELLKADVGILGMGKSDPYAVLTVGSQEFKTPVITNTVQPKWNYYCEVVVDQLQGQTIDVELMDQDQSSKDDFLGRLTVPIFPLALRGHANMWIRLEQVETGQLHFSTEWLTLSDKQSDLKVALESIKSISTKTKLSSALLLVYIDSAKHLPNVTKASGEPSPQVTLVIAQQKKQTIYCRYTNHPVWEESFQFLLPNPEDLELTIQVNDYKSGKPLGHTSIPMSRFLNENTMDIEEPFLLRASGSLSNIFVSLKLKILIPNKAAVAHMPQLSEEEKLLEEQIAQKDDLDSPGDEKKGIPSLEEMVQSTVSPIAETANIHPKDAPDGTTRSPSSSDRSPTQEASTVGRVQVTIRYSLQRNKLIVVVHKTVDLPKIDGSLPDPYMKLYLMPDRSREGKQKTSTCKGTCNPVFDETFEFDMMMADAASRSLEITANSKSGSSVFSRGLCLGKTTIALSQLDLTKTVTSWYNLDAKDE